MTVLTLLSTALMKVGLGIGAVMVLGTFAEMVLPPKDVIRIAEHDPQRCRRLGEW